MDNQTITEAVASRIPPGQRVVIIGLGGVGSIVARYGAAFFASLGKSVRCVLVDGDTFEPKNAARMIFKEMGPKAEVVANEINERIGEMLVIDSLESYVTPENISEVIRSGDIVFSCVDNHATRKVIGTYCADTLKGDILLLSGGNDGVEGKQRGTYGNVQVYYRRNGEVLTPTIERYHPEIANPKDKAPDELSCTEMMDSVPQVVFANLAVASAMLSACLTVLSGRHHYAEVGFDIVDAKMGVIPVPGVKKEGGY